jgi:hypothetical protein
MPSESMPVLAVERVCKVRTYRDRWERLDWLQCWAAGLVNYGTGAW